MSLVRAGHMSPSVARLGANRQLAAQVNGYRPTPPSGPGNNGPGQTPGVLDNGELEVLRRYLASLGRR